MSILDKFIRFYYKQIFTNSTHNLNLNANKYFIIDYANIIHILYEKYKDSETVFKKFNHFLCKYSKTNLIFIVSKTVNIEGNQMDATNIKVLKNVYLFNIEYKITVSSNIDDLLTHFLCVVIFVGLVRLKIEPKHKILLVTNDKQNFQKNLFELTKDEKLNDVKITEISVNGKHKITGIKTFLREYMTCEKINPKCSITKMVKTLKRNDFDYRDLNGMQKKITNKCMKHSRKNGNLKKYFYLYVYIKYIQNYLNDDFYGSMSKEKIISLIQ